MSQYPHIVLAASTEHNNFILSNSIASKLTSSSTGSIESTATTTDMASSGTTTASASSSQREHQSSSSSSAAMATIGGILKRQQTPAFLEKLFDILEEGNPYAGLISWQPDGNSFIIKKVNEFSEIVLPKYFKHSNIQSYIRQLNMYGFSKTRHDSNHHEFTHKLFQRGRRDLLPFIRRKTQQSSRTSNNSGGNNNTGNSSSGAIGASSSTANSLPATSNSPSVLHQMAGHSGGIPSFIDLSRRHSSAKASSSSVSKSSEESQVSQGGEDDVGDNLQYSDGPQSLEARIEQLESQLFMVTEHCLELTNQYNQLCEALQLCHKYQIANQHSHLTLPLLPPTRQTQSIPIIKREFQLLQPSPTVVAASNNTSSELDGHPLKRMKSCDGSSEPTASSTAPNDTISLESPSKKVAKVLLDEKFANTDFLKYQTTYAAWIPREETSSFYPPVAAAAAPNSSYLGEKLERKSYSVDLGGLEAITAAAHILDRGPPSASKRSASEAYQGGPLVKSFSYGP